MTTVFASIPTPKGGWRNKSKAFQRNNPLDNRLSGSSSSKCQTPDNNSFEVEPEEPNLRELNSALQALTEIFPDIQPEVLREMLTNFDEESRLEVVTEQLLKHAAKWVRGRYRLPQDQEPEHKYRFKTRNTVDTRGSPLATVDKFRNESYKAAVRNALYSEFKGLSHSTIRAVLAEYNYSYIQARPTLLDLATKSWRFSITSFFMRRKAPSANDHPLVTWETPDPKVGGPAVPHLIYTTNAELNKELYDVLIVPVLTSKRAEQVHRDRQIAEELNEEEATAVGDMYDCECCFTPSPFEQIALCDNERGGHFLCFRCIRHAVHEALYGQGWTRNISVERSTLRCIAPVSDSPHDCAGCIPLAELKAALSSSLEEDGETTWRKLHERAGSESLLKTQLPVIKCPFCSYAEIDDIYLNSQNLSWKLKKRPLATLSLISLSHFAYLEALRLILHFFVLFFFLFVSLNYLLPRPLPLMSPLLASRHRVERKRRGLKFTCQSPHCGRSSCLNCCKEWHDIHICYESQLASLRQYVESAMTNSLKRTCPNCNLSFVKASGCNKLTCVCGYMMCYVCRQDIGKESYGHFCQHFRAVPGSQCQDCEKCDLYRTEDDEIVAKKAREQAEREWWEKERGKGEGMSTPPLDWEQTRDVNSVFAGVQKSIWKRKTREDWVDAALDALIA